LSAPDSEAEGQGQDEPRAGDQPEVMQPLAELSWLAPGPPRSAERSTLTNAAGESLDHAFTPGDPGRRSIVVIAHGVTGQHDRPYLNSLAEGLAGRGLAALQITYAGNGRSGGRFEECTISKEVADLGSVLDTLDGWSVGYAGHSMGGAVGVLRTAQDARLRALCSLAGMVQVQAFMERVFGDLAPGDPMLGREQCPLSAAFLADARDIHDTLGAAREIDVPWLLVHGTQDELVPYSDSEEAQAASGGADLVPLPGADHRLTGHVEAMVDSTAAFFDEHLP
jgi:alpha-beta hydrolase superfamily lysophospholipase